MTDNTLGRDLFKTVLDAVDKGDWKIAAGAALAIFVYLIRVQVLARLPLADWGRAGRWIAWFETKPGGVALAVASGYAGALSTALLAREPVTWHLALSALYTSVIGSGLYAWWKNRKRPKRQNFDESAPVAPPPVRPGVGGTATIEVLIFLATVGLLAFVATLVRL